MKELSIEQKARRYDEAIEKFDVILNLNTVKESGTIFADDVRKIFPELKGNDDENIIEEIKALVESAPLIMGLDKKNKIFAWLEKQGEQKIDSDTLIQQRVDALADIVAEQNPTDKVEPKFKVGDWVVSNYNNVCYVESISETKYNLQCKDGNHEKMSIEYIDSCWHLWTIQDAKDGDVLACNEEILLFKSYSVQGRISLYCWYNWQTNNFHSKEVVDTLITTRNEICPATKEQHILLFQKMEEAGYEWDAEKKELKKIEQKPAWSEEDYIEIKRITGLLEGWASTFEKTFYEKECKRGVAWLKNLKDRVLPQSKQVWSEEDKDIWLEIKSLIDSLISEGENANYREYDLQKMWDWLDTIWQKDRIQTQPKQKWNGTEIAPPIDSDVCG